MNDPLGDPGVMEELDPMGDPGVEADPLGDPGSADASPADPMGDPGLMELEQDPLGDPGMSEADPLGDPGKLVPRSSEGEGLFENLRLPSLSDLLYPGRVIAGKAGAAMRGALDTANILPRTALKLSDFVAERAGWKHEDPSPGESTLTAPTLYEDITRPMRRALGGSVALGEALEAPTREMLDENQARLARAMESGGLGWKAAEQVAQVSTSLLVDLAGFKAAGIGGGAHTTREILKDAGKAGAYVFATTPGDEATKARAAAVTAAFFATPSLTTKLPSDAAAIAVSTLLNMGITTLNDLPHIRGVVKDSIEEAKADGREGDWWKYTLTNLIPVYGPDVVFGLMARSAKAANDPTRLKLATPDVLHDNLVELFGQDKVVRAKDGSSVQVSLPDGRKVVYEFVGDEAWLKQRDPAAFFRSVRASKDPRDRKIAEEMLEDAGGNEAAAGKALRDVFEAVGVTQRNVLVRDATSGLQVKADVLVQLVAGKAKLGDMKEEDLHAVLKLAGLEQSGGKVRDPKSGRVLDEEALARALNDGTQHPVAQRVRDLALRVTNLFRRDPQDSLFETASRLRSDLADEAGARALDRRAVDRTAEGESIVSRQGRVAALAEEPQGPAWEAVTPKGEGTVRGEWKLVPADELVTSQDKGYDQALQPRNRDTVASLEQIDSIARGPRPAELMDMPTTDGGAPIVSPDGHVISGNGRVLGLRGAYANDAANPYRAQILERAGQLGLPVDPNMRNPVLVRVVRDSGGMPLDRLAELSNQPKVMVRSTAEMAEADGKLLLDSGLIERFSPDALGFIRAASNNEFLGNFVQGTGAKELLMSQGGFDPAIDGRVRRAVLAAVLSKDPQSRALVQDLVERADSLGVQRQRDGVMAAAGQLVKLGRAKPEYDISADVAQGLRDLVRYQRDRQEGLVRTLDDYLSQQEMFGTGRTDASLLLLKAMVENPGVGSTRGLLERYVSKADRIDTSTPDMFGEKNATALDVLRRAFNERELAEADAGRVGAGPAEGAGERAATRRREGEAVARDVEGARRGVGPAEAEGPGAAGAEVVPPIGSRGRPEFQGLEERLATRRKEDHNIAVTQGKGDDRSSKTPRTPERSSGITSEQDKVYTDAVRRGDLETVRKVIDEILERIEGAHDRTGKFKWRESVPSVGVRVGKIPPAGKSFNTRENKYEDGVSLVSAGNLPRLQSFAISNLNDRGAELVFMRGRIKTRLGGDDEFVMTDSRPISKAEYEAAISSDQQHLADYVLSGYRWDLAGRTGGDVEKWVAANKLAKSNIYAVRFDSQGKVIPISERITLFDSSATGERSGERLATRRKEVDAAGRPMRGTVLRVVNSEEFKAIQADLRANPEAYYDPQSLKSIQERNGKLSDADLDAKLGPLDRLTLEAGANNDLMAAAAEKVMRAQARGDTAGAKAAVLAMGKNLTTIAQLLRQAAILKTSTPEGMVGIVEVLHEQKTGRPLPEADKKKLLSTADADIKATGKLLEAEEAFRKKPTAKAAEDLDAAGAAAEKSKRAWIAKSAENLPKDWADTIRLLMQGNALTSSSIIANTVGNTVNFPLRAIGRTIGATTEGVLGALGLVKTRTLGQPMADTWAYVKGVGKALKQTGATLKTGVNLQDIMAGGEVVRGFQPYRAWVRQFSSGPRAAERMKLLVEQTIGVPAEAVFRLLSVTDAPFYGGAYNAALHEIGNLRGLSGKKLEQFMKVPDAASKKLAEERAREAVYQGDKSKLARGITRLSGAIGDRKTSSQLERVAAELMLRPVLLFSKTPANVLSEAHKFLNPAYSAWDIARQVSNKNQREAFMAFGRMATGMMIWSAVDAIVKAGLVAGSVDNDKEQDLAQVAGLQPLHINASGLKRLMDGEDPSFRDGDEQWDYRNLGIIGLALNIAATGDENLRNKAWARGEAYDAESVNPLERSLAVNVGLPAALLNASMMKGTASLLQGISRKDPWGWMTQWFETVSGIALPGTLRQVARYKFEEMPETKAQALDNTFRAEAEAAAREAMNRIQVKMEGFKAMFGPRQARIEDLPVKLDLLGRAVKNTPAGAGPISFHFVDTRKPELIPTDKYASEIRRVYMATRSRGVIPSIPDNTLRHDGQSIRLNERQLQRLRHIQGTFYTWGMDNAMRGPWGSWNDLQRAAYLTTVNARAREYAKATLWGELHGGGLT